MEIESFFKKMKEIYQVLMDFIDAIEDSDAELVRLIHVLNKEKILQNKEETQILFQLLSKISYNYHRSSDFFTKLEKIFQYLIQDTHTPISELIPNYRDYNKQIIFLLLNKKLIQPDEIFLKNYMDNVSHNETCRFQ